ncbi:MAG: alcohol dehydrogenase catalytic domain-containing protein [Alphaproteobacteria bacterium]|nr:alcohol dehydrogenase catalytic domain-containing protein [Alphaproteobacteria bacterium]
MKALVLDRRGKDGLSVRNFPTPERPPGNALIRVRAAALNHVDLYIRDAGKGITHPMPMVLGVDAAGEVVEADADSGLTPGQRVLAFPSEFCGRCDYCLAGQQPYCRNISIIGEQRHGGFAEYLSMKAHNFVPIPDDLSWHEAAALPAVRPTADRMRGKPLTDRNIALHDPHMGRTSSSNAKRHVPAALLIPFVPLVDRPAFV